ncbi:hypothetical protein Sden_2253 [Shewanella denitrificans OS217]|jgi:hypothetical protein|uniref:Uncharacterized protein n=1 Tax=Shewanella denitrificans (strain OS217 / ATCC BAA-1090 / DSM 15013) TaxID=318161 RepID=Q12LZ3_SHEDO|nr:hypothetical protein [Shewanella denitrificans]ABE55533.1 hypothetical protein Sden_2253 [Shewanella denitrificans OS217]
MQLIFSDPYYDTKKWDEAVFSNEIKNSLIQVIDEDLNVHYSNIGHGADCPSILVELFNSIDWKAIAGTSLVGAFLLGEKINKNLDAWTAIGKKVNAIIKKFNPARIDEKAALAWVINDLAEKGQVQGIIELNIQVVPFTSGPCKTKLQLESQPDNLYVISVKLKNNVFVYGLKSNTKLEFLKEFDTFWNEF